MAKNTSKLDSRWRVHHFILYLINAGDDTYWIYHVPLSDGGGSLIDLDLWVLPKDEVSDSGRYTRRQVINMASLAGHTEEQIQAALLIADNSDALDHRQFAKMGDKDYERLIKNALKRVIYRCRHRIKQDARPTPTI
jgi:hypothetical protein